MTNRFMLISAVISGLIFMTPGTFDVHVLSQSLGVAEMAWTHTDLEYQAFHTLAILGLAMMVQRRISIWSYWSSVPPALGAVLFGGSLYCLALPHLRLQAFATPVDGVSFLIGWVLILAGAIRPKRKGVAHEQGCSLLSPWV